MTEVKVNDRMERLLEEWDIVEMFGPESKKCFLDAVISASITGSTGATYSIGGDVVEESSCTVERRVHAA